jgi:uncharacterized DUF497 family protein
MHGYEIHLGRGESGAQSAEPWDLVRDGSGSVRGPNHIVTENYRFEDEREQRYMAIGMTRNLVLVVVVFVDRSEAAVEIIHIISARKAVAYEQSIYEDQTG